VPSIWTPPAGQAEPNSDTKREYLRIFIVKPPLPSSRCKNVPVPIWADGLVGFKAKWFYRGGYLGLYVDVWYLLRMDPQRVLRLLSRRPVSGDYAAGNKKG
jgi:hypothetical protein